LTYFEQIIVKKVLYISKQKNNRDGQIQLIVTFKANKRRFTNLSIHFSQHIR